MASSRDRLARAATVKIPGVAGAIADVVSGRALGRNLAGGVKFPNPPRQRRQVSYLAGTRPRARVYTKGAGRPD